MDGRNGQADGTYGNIPALKGGFKSNFSDLFKCKKWKSACIEETPVLSNQPRFRFTSCACLTQTGSKTEWVTSYTLPWIPGSRVNFNLNIIDTPGFGGYGDTDRDRKIVQQIRFFFESLDERGCAILDAVFFVVQASICRLSPTQKYIFDTVLSLFGNDVKDNIFVLVTFTDGARPPVLDALEEFNFPSKWKIILNNSALFLDPKQAENGRFFWQMTQTSYEEIFKKLASSKSKYLCLTKEVLETRKMIEDNLTIIQCKIERGTEKQDEIREEEKILQKYERDVADNKDFEYTVMEEKVVHEKLPQGKHTTVCTLCNVTCHEHCKYGNDKDKAKCSSMKNGYCTKCEKHCKWDLHYNYPYIIRPKKMESRKTYSEMKKRYMGAMVEKDKKLSILGAMRMEYDKIMDDYSFLVDEVKKCLNQLNEIALKPNPVSEIEYIDILIQNEKDGRTEGYKDRLTNLKRLRGKAEILAKIHADNM